MGRLHKTALPSMVGTIQPTEALMEQRMEEGGICPFRPASLFELGHSSPFLASRLEFALVYRTPDSD